MAANRIDDRRPALLRQRLARFGKRGAIDDFAGAQLLEVVVLRGAAGGRNHSVTQPAQQRDGKTADAAIGAGDQDFALLGRHAVVLQRQNAQHRCVTCGADGHGLRSGECIGQWNQPVAIEAGFLRQTAPMPFTDTPTIEQDFVTDLVVRMPADFHSPCQINPRHHREFSHHRAAASDCQAILEVQRAVRHSHRHIALGQLIFIDLLQCGPVTAFVFVDQNTLEHDCLLVGSPVVV
ncbi:hypothetical protein D3C86_1322620 [compost metagenome]